MHLYMCLGLYLSIECNTLRLWFASSCHVWFFNLLCIFFFRLTIAEKKKQFNMCLSGISIYPRTYMWAHAKKKHHLSDLGLFALFFFSRTFSMHIFVFALYFFFEKWVKETTNNKKKMKKKINTIKKIIILDDR